MGLPVSSRQLSFAESLKSYPSRNPSETILYKVVQENVETFIQMAEVVPNRKGLPEYVKREFYEYLRCGILANGFLRVQCTECKHERLVAFSCRGRGFCPSCGGRRMCELAAFLVDEVFPHVPIRQVVLSFPFPIRFWMAKNPKLQSEILTITIRAVSGLLRKKAKAKGLKRKLEYAVVTVIQRFGGSINLNPHLHMLWVDGLYDVSGEKSEFHELPSPTDEEIKTLVETLSQRILRSLKRKGYPVDDDADIRDEDDETLDDVQSASVQSIIALGERRGQKVRRIGLIERGNFEGAVLEGERCASHRGFSLHANVRCGAEEREKLEHMVRYIARPPVAMDRLHRRRDGLITYRLKKKFRDGTEQLLFSPLELLEKLAALVPRPRAHITRYHGAFAPHSKARHKIVKGRSGKDATSVTEDAGSETKEKTESRMSWAKLLNRVFNIDITQCQFCRAEVKVLAAVLEKTAIEKILNHLRLPTEPPVIHPARPPPQASFDDFGQSRDLDLMDS
jgi:Putative transposase/Transposase zinc-binding domain